MSEAPRRRRRRSDNTDEVQISSPQLADSSTNSEVVQQSFPEERTYDESPVTQQQSLPAQRAYDEFTVSQQQPLPMQRKYNEFPDIQERKVIIQNEDPEEYRYNQQEKRNQAHQKRAEHVINYEDLTSEEIDDAYKNIKKIKKRNKRSVLLLISAIIGTLYALYIISYFFGVDSSSLSGSDALGHGIATVLVMPHIASTVMAVIFNWLGYFLKTRGFALTAAILYSVAAFVFIMYAMFVIPEIVLSFVAYAKMKKKSV